MITTTSARTDILFLSLRDGVRAALHEKLDVLVGCSPWPEPELVQWLSGGFVSHQPKVGPDVSFAWLGVGVFISHKKPRMGEASGAKERENDSKIYPNAIMPTTITRIAAANAPNQITSSLVIMPPPVESPSA